MQVQNNISPDGDSRLTSGNEVENVITESPKTSVKLFVKRSWKELLSYFNLTNDLETQADAEKEIRSGVSFKGSQLLILIFAIFVASLGLNTNSIPVIIGAMLISPLMGPIIGMGLGIGIGDFKLVTVGLRNILMAVAGSILASALYFLISPQYGDSSQLLARTSPSIYDVFIALFGGSAGIVSIACKNKGQVMPGVAIATSLMPPLCTAGYGLATWQASFFFGALYLFFTNMIFILFASWIGVKLFRYRPVVYSNLRRAKRVRFVVYLLVGATIGVSTYLTMIMLRQSIFKSQADQFVATEMVFPNTQVFSHKEYIKGGKKYLDVTLIGATLPKDSLKLALMTKMDSCGLGGTILNIKQGFGITDNVKTTSQSFDQLYPVIQSELTRKQAEIDSLNNVISRSSLFSRAGNDIADEVKVLFPNVKDIALATTVAASVNAPEKLDTIGLIFVNAPAGLPSRDRSRLTQFISVRTKEQKLRLLVNPATFPWPQAKPSE